MEITIMNARQSNGTSKQLRQKSWTKSILFSGLIGFNFLTSDAFSSFNMDIDNDRKARINEFVKEHPGFDPCNIGYALSRIKVEDGQSEAQLQNQFFNLLDEWTPKISELGWDNSRFSKFIFNQAAWHNGITIAELEQKLQLENRINEFVKEYPGFDPFRISYALSHIKGSYDEFFDFLNEWTPKISELGWDNRKFSGFIFAQANLHNEITIAKLEQKLKKELK